MTNFFRKASGVMTALMICCFAYAQPEPTNEGGNLTAKVGEEDTSLTENYLVADFEAFVDKVSSETEVGDSFRNVSVSFLIKDLTVFGSARIEILAVSEDGRLRVVTEDFLLSQLTLKKSSAATEVIVPIAYYPSDTQYTVNIMVQSAEGMIDRILTKIILL